MTSALAVQAPLACRARNVTLAERLSQKVLGAPQVRHAHGGYAERLGALRTDAWMSRRRETPVFEVDRRGVEACERLPRLWLTEPLRDRLTGEPLGREYVGSYPNGADRGGCRAFELANRYVGEARSYEDVADEATAVACYQAAEILYLHAVARGNAEAYVRLADMYDHDRCQGAYWEGALEGRARHGARISLGERVVACLSEAVELGSAEACLRLGELLVASEDAQSRREGMGLMKKGYDVAVERFGGDTPISGPLQVEFSYQAGDIALRIARCQELGKGCVQCFETALVWYQIAARMLSFTLENGSWACKRSLFAARKGAARMAQEIAGCY